jgi:hypothetical protein
MSLIVSNRTKFNPIALANIRSQTNNFCGGGLGGSSHYEQKKQWLIKHHHYS